MRNVVESTLISIDGVIGEPYLWAGEHFGEEAVARAMDQLGHSDAMVMGRRTYEMFSTMWAEPVTDYDAAIYSIPKYVVSSTLETADWNNSTVVRGDVASAVHDLKQQPGQDIVLYGHGSVGQTLLEAGLLDELKLWIHPVVVGTGSLWFREGKRLELELVGTDTTNTGVVIATYRPTA
jgi:dihydrofolate reductase